MNRIEILTWFQHQWRKLVSFMIGFEFGFYIRLFHWRVWDIFFLKSEGLCLGLNFLNNRMKSLSILLVNTNSIFMSVKSRVDNFFKNVTIKTQLLFFFNLDSFIFCNSFRHWLNHFLTQEFRGTFHILDFDKFFHEVLQKYMCRNVRLLEVIDGRFDRLITFRILNFVKIRLEIFEKIIWFVYLIFLRINCITHFL